MSLRPHPLRGWVLLPQALQQTPRGLLQEKQSPSPAAWRSRCDDPPTSVLSAETTLCQARAAPGQGHGPRWPLPGGGPCQQRLTRGTRLCHLLLSRPGGLDGPGHSQTGPLTRGTTHPRDHSPAGPLTRGTTDPRDHSPTGPQIPGTTHPRDHSPAGPQTPGTAHPRDHSPAGPLTRETTHLRDHRPPGPLTPRDHRPPGPLTRETTHPRDHRPPGPLTRGTTHSSAGPQTPGTTHPWDHTPAGPLTRGSCGSKCPGLLLAPFCF
ncbi:uncharacterized protein C1orf159 homolog isoform X2 [Lemur catta]|uniref:uncharacterized protein C1orf159 homolog isoform X2 n=1 Tax=Lemur catta TaxID=9447 RepID=UPI001E268ADC|nr:uncharacterized protein C1orf159 homolog isoform X2 [Lemur catta]